MNIRGNAMSIPISLLVYLFSYWDLLLVLTSTNNKSQITNPQTKKAVSSASKQLFLFMKERNER